MLVDSLLNRNHSTHKKSPRIIVLLLPSQVWELDCKFCHHLFEAASYAGQVVCVVIDT